MPSSSLYLNYGGDFARSPQGGLLLATDTPTNPIATNQRIERVLRTNPVLLDAFGNVEARGDSYFYPNSGVGIGRAVGSQFDSDQIKKLQAAILNGLASLPEIVSYPAPIISLDLNKAGQFFIQITYQLSSGQTFTTPAYNLSGGSS